MEAKPEKKKRNIGRRLSDEETPVRDKVGDLTNIIITVFTVFMAGTMTWIGVNTKETNTLIYEALIEIAKDQKDIQQNAKDIERNALGVDTVKKDVRLVEKWISKHDTRVK